MLRASFVADLRAIGALDAHGSDAAEGQGGFVDRALAYAALLAKWNARIRLVGPSDLETIVREQVVDALGFSLAVEALADEAFWDVGAGGGLPGILLALRFPARRFVLIEPIHKKTAFLQHAAHELGLANVVVHTGRVEHEGAVAPPLRWPGAPASRPQEASTTTSEGPGPRASRPQEARPTAALSRATLAPDPWLATARRLVGPGGTVLIAVAGAIPDSITADPSSTPAGTWRWTVPATGAPRTLVARRIT